MPCAVFLDRDGVINRLVYNRATRAYESPHSAKDLSLLPGVLAALRSLQKAGYLLFLVSNQPSYAKGKTSLKNIKMIQQKFHKLLKNRNINFKKYYYCYHHPYGLVSKYSKVCKCRKPSPYFLLQACEIYKLSMKASWMIGDRETDIQCGRSAGVNTIYIKGNLQRDKSGNIKADYNVQNLKEAVKIILRSTEQEDIDQYGNKRS